MATLQEVNALEQKIANANRYISSVKDPTKKAGATAKLADYQNQLSSALQALYAGSNESAMPAQEPVQETGNVAVDQANVLSSILNSPLYTEEIKSAYLTQYLPGLTQANYEINKARSQEVQNAFLRQQAQAQAIREIAGSYAARGLRTPKMVTEGFAPVQQSTEMQRSAAEQAINDLVANKEVMFGVGTTDQESFIKNPTLFGSVGAGARRTALSNLQQLPEAYGLTQVSGASRSPFNEADREYKPTGTVYVQRFDNSWGPAYTANQIQAKIDAAKKYITQQQAKGNTKNVTGATGKLQTYQSELEKLRGAN